VVIPFTIHYGLNLILYVVKVGLRPSEIVVICLYPYQCSLWCKALSRFPDLAEVSIATADSMQGWENRFIIRDTVRSANSKGAYAWVADRRCICVSLIPGHSGLVILGDGGILDEKFLMNKAGDEAEDDQSTGSYEGDHNRMSKICD
jgi:hypothetical protein